MSRTLSSLLSSTSFLCSPLSLTHFLFCTQTGGFVRPEGWRPAVASPAPAPPAFAPTGCAPPPLAPTALEIACCPV
eukprot:166260-Pleurochrysis_carterae.AAC.2